MKLFLIENPIGQKGVFIAKNFQDLLTKNRKGLENLRKSIKQYGLETHIITEVNNYTSHSQCIPLIKQYKTHETPHLNHNETILERISKYDELLKLTRELNKKDQKRLEKNRIKQQELRTTQKYLDKITKKKADTFLKKQENAIKKYPNINPEWIKSLSLMKLSKLLNETLLPGQSQTLIFKGLDGKNKILKNLAKELLEYYQNPIPIIGPNQETLILKCINSIE